MDEQILQLKEKLLQDINSSNLPISVLSLIIGELSTVVNAKQAQKVQEIRIQKIKDLQEKENRKEVN